MNAPDRINYPAAPLANVWLQSGFQIADGAWGKTVRYTDLVGLGAAILCAVVLKLGRLSGSEIAYLRRKLDLSQAECARVMGVEEQTLSLWERGRYPIPISTDALIRRICIEKLRTAFPRKTRFPKTSALVQLANSMSQGEYVAKYENGNWIVSYMATQTEQLTAKPVTSTNFVTWQRMAADFRQPATYGDANASAQVFDIRQLGKLDDRAPLEIFVGGTRTNIPVEIERRPFKAKLLRAEARGLVAATYGINPETNALYMPKALKQ